ncbi:MAG TPA: DUF465 domain-containing protein [Alphaproteobacteria bacterium]
MPISTQGHKATLLARKAQLEADLHRETQSRAPNHLVISAIKRQKLVIKDQLAEAS